MMIMKVLGTLSFNMHAAQQTVCDVSADIVSGSREVSWYS